MRISADKTDPDYREDAWRYLVYLDENRALLRDAQGKQIYITGKGKFTVVRSPD